MRSSALVGCILLLGILVPSEGRAACGGECDGRYSSAISDCHFQYGDDPADAVPTEKPFFAPSPATRFPERAEGVEGPKH